MAEQKQTYEFIETPATRLASTLLRKGKGLLPSLCRRAAGTAQGLYASLWGREAPSPDDLPLPDGAAQAALDRLVAKRTRTTAGGLVIFGFACNWPLMLFIIGVALVFWPITLVILALGWMQVDRFFGRPTE